MNRFFRVLVGAMLAMVLTAAVTSISSADAGKPGTTVQINRQGLLTPGVMRPVTPAASEGKSGYFAGQYFDYTRFYDYLFWNYKYYFGTL